MAIEFELNFEYIPTPIPIHSDAMSGTKRAASEAVENELRIVNTSDFSFTSHTNQIDHREAESQTRPRIPAETARQEGQSTTAALQHKPGPRETTTSLMIITTSHHKVMLTTPVYTRNTSMLNTTPLMMDMTVPKLKTMAAVLRTLSCRMMTKAGIVTVSTVTRTTARLWIMRTISTTIQRPKPKRRSR